MIQLTDLNIPESVELTFVVDCYDRIGNSQSCCYVFPDGTLENVRNKDMFLTFNVFNQFSSSDVTDFDGYIFPKSLPICFFTHERDEETNIIKTKISFTKDSIHLKDLVLQNYIISEGKETISLSEELVDISISEEDFEKVLNDFCLEDFLINYFKNLDISLYESEKYKNYISLLSRPIS